jgi:hypothetical protein
MAELELQEMQISRKQGRKRGRGLRGILAAAAGDLLSEEVLAISQITAARNDRRTRI